MTVSLQYILRGIFRKSFPIEAGIRVEKACSLRTLAKQQQQQQQQRQ